MCNRPIDREASICPPGVSVVNFQLKEQMREGFVLSVGALTPLKGFDFIIQSLGTLPSEIRPRLVIVSNYQEPAELLYLQSLADQYAVRFTCYRDLSDEELLTLYARAGCVAYAPIREPLGLVALEAMAGGAPLVGINEGGVAETIIDFKTGILAPRDPVVFGNAVHRLLTDKKLAEQLSKEGRHYVLEKWAWNKHVEQLEELLMETACASTKKV